MKTKASISQQVYHFFIIQWWNHLWNYTLLGMILVGSYFVIKVSIQWLIPLMILDQYQSGILACIVFYVGLQILKKPPNYRRILEALDRIVLHSRASTYWQYRKSQTCVSNLLENECQLAFEQHMKPIHTYIEVKTLKILLALVLLAAYLLIGNLPSTSKERVKEMKAFNKTIEERIEMIQEAEDALDEKELEPLKQESPELNQALEKAHEDLLDDLKKSYKTEDVLKALNDYEKKREGLMTSAENKIRDLPKEEGEKILKPLDQVKKDTTRDQVLDALGSQDQQERAGENKDQESLTESFTELMSQSEDNGMSSTEDLELASETIGSQNDRGKNGQGGSGQSYSGDTDIIEEGSLFRDDAGETLIDARGADTLQITTDHQGETHLALGKGLEASNEAVTINDQGQFQIKVNKRTIIIPKGIPQERLPLIQAYMKENK
jgi:hypothetical protein